MTLAIPSGARLRHSSWYVALLLPVLPVLAITALGMGDRPESFHDVLIGGNVPSLFVFPWVLLVVGVAIAFGIPWFLERASASLRKEADLLRPAWLTCLFVAQAPLLAGENAMEGALTFFVGTCVLLGAIPFGVEFQCRTMAGLLSQPIERATLWRNKMGLLAGALLTHWTVFMLSCFVMSHEVEAWMPPALLIAAAIAWGTTTWWTLLTRGVLAGIVFSFAVPLAVFVSLQGLVEIAHGMGLLGDLPRAGAFELTLKSLVFAAGPLYGIAGWYLGRRRWMRWEAMDQPSGDTGGVFLPAWAAWSSSRENALPWVRSLLVKEYRLQSVTLIACASTLLLGLAAALAGENVVRREFLQAMLALMWGVTVLLAGATSIAEERRLGILDSQLLVPVSRGSQWWIKVGFAAGLWLGASAIFAVFIPAAANGDPGPREFALYLVAPAIFAASVFTSSASASSLRALLFALLFVGAGWLLGFFLVAQGDAWFSSLHQQLASTTPEQVVQARHLGEAEASVLMKRSNPGGLQRLLAASIIISVATPCVLALVFARRNFARPAGAERRAVRQAGTCLGAGGLAALVMSLILGFQLARARDARVLLDAYYHARIEASLSPAERRLWDGYQSWKPFQVMVPMRTGTNTKWEISRDGNTVRAEARATMTCKYQLPLSPGDRALLIRHAELPQDLRQLLHEDALRLGDSATATELPPEPVPLEFDFSSPRHGVFQMSPELMRRYGLLPSLGAERGPAVQPGLTAPEANEPPTQQFQMSPELLRRYGLTPQDPGESTNTLETPRP
jgi:hypothetical protein